MSRWTESCGFSPATLFGSDTPTSLPCFLSSSHFSFASLYIESLHSCPVSGSSFCSTLGLLSSVGYSLQIVAETPPSFVLHIINTQRHNDHMETLINPQARNKTTWECKGMDSCQISFFLLYYKLLLEFCGYNTQLPPSRKLSFWTHFYFCVVWTLS